MRSSRCSSSLYDSISSGNTTGENISKIPERPASCLIAPTKSRLKEPKTPEVPKPPGYISKAPQPLKLGNVGQVRAIAAVFDQSELTSAPNSPLCQPITFESEFNSYRPSKLPQSHYESPPVRQKCRSTEVQRKSYGAVTPRSMLKSPAVAVVSRSESAKVPYENVSPLLQPRRIPTTKLPQSHYLTPSPMLRSSARPMEVSTPNSNSSANSSTWSVAKMNGNLRKNFLLPSSNEISPVSVRKMVETDKVFSSAKEFDAYVHPDRIRPVDNPPTDNAGKITPTKDDSKNRQKRRSLLELFKHKK